MKEILRALGYFRQDSPKVAGVFALLFTSCCLGLLQPWPVAFLVDSILGDKPFPAWMRSMTDNASKPTLVLLVAGFTLAVTVVQGLLSATQNYLAIGVGLRGLARVRNEIFASLQRLSLRFHQGSKSGDIVYRASWDTYSFQTLFQQGLITCVTATLTLALMIAVMASFNLLLTAVAVATVPLLILTIKYFGNKMSERSSAAQQADSQVTSFVQQSMAALPLIQSYTRESHEEAKFEEQTAVARDKRLQQHGWELIYWLAIATVFGLGTAAIIWAGGHQVLAGKLTVGQLLIFLAYLGKLYEPLNQLSHVGATVSGATAGVKRVFEILDTPEEVKDSPNARSVQRSGPSVRQQDAKEVQPLLVRGDIAFENVAFGYDRDREILRDISFKLNSGESAALIGPSGVGKTTLMNLLPRFFDPTSGTVTLDNVDLRELKVRDLRSQIAVVLQEPILLPTSIAENIAYGRPEATREQIEVAARSANAHIFIERLPHKYDTVVGDGAARLSVGERQRLNLARAFLKDAPILLLDEPTSALDAESEALVVSSLQALMKGRTTLIVAHRLTTIRQVSKIIVLDDGRVAEMGSHDQLVERGGYYARFTGGQVALD